MPQLDFGTWFNQTTSVLVGFWFLTYLFFFVFLTQGSWLMKFRTKLGALRYLLNTTFTAQTINLEAEVAGVQLLAVTQTLATTHTLIGGSSNATFSFLGGTLNEVLDLTTDFAVELEGFNDLQLALPEEEVEEDSE